MTSQDKINQLQLLQQNLQNIMLQKQQVQNQLVELDSALTELKGTDKAYKIIGKIMLAASNENISKDLEQKKEVADLRLKSFIKQEEKLQQSIENLQKEIMEEMKKEKSKKN